MSTVSPGSRVLVGAWLAATTWSCASQASPALPSPALRIASCDSGAVLGGWQRYATETVLYHDGLVSVTRHGTSPGEATVRSTTCLSDPTAALADLRAALVLAPESPATIATCCAIEVASERARRFDCATFDVPGCAQLVALEATVRAAGIRQVWRAALDEAASQDGATSGIEYRRELVGGLGHGATRQYSLVIAAVVSDVGAWCVVPEENTHVVTHMTTGSTTPSWIARVAQRVGSSANPVGDAVEGSTIFSIRILEGSNVRESRIDPDLAGEIEASLAQSGCLGRRGE